jgi:hypothetical protein
VIDLTAQETTMNKRLITPAVVVDLCAYLEAHRPREAAEVAGRFRYERNLAEARASVGGVMALASRDVESVALALHRAVGEDIDDVTFAELVNVFAAEACG